MSYLGRTRGCLPRPRPEESEPRASPRDARPRRARPRVAHVETTRWRSRSRMPRGPHGPLPVARAWAAPGHMTWYLPWRTCTYPKAQRAACAHPLARRSLSLSKTLVELNLNLRITQDQGPHLLESRYSGWNSPPGSYLKIHY